MGCTGWGSLRNVLIVSEASGEPSSTAASERPFTGAMVSTSGGGSAAVSTRQGTRKSKDLQSETQ